MMLTDTHVGDGEVADGVIRAVLLGFYLHMKLLEDLHLSLWGRPVLHTFHLRHTQKCS